MIMKKRLLLVATAVALLFGFSACEGESIDLTQLSGKDLLGHIHLKASDQNNHINVLQNDPIMSPDVDSMRFKSALCCVKIDTNGLGGIEKVIDAGASFFGSYSEVMVDANNNIQWPLIGINLSDTVPGDYQIEIPMVEGDISFIENLNQNNWKYYLLNNDIEIQGGHPNMMIIAVDTNKYYVCYEGKIRLDEFSAVGQRVKGRVQNVKAFYITNDQVRAIIRMSEADRNSLQLDRYLPTVTLNGEISSMRMASENVNVIEALEEL